MVDTLQGDESLPVNENDLSTDYALKIFLATFKFSQGFPPLQEYYFGRIHDMRQNWKISDQTSQDLTDQATREVMKFMGIQEDEPAISTSRSYLHTVKDEEGKVILTRRIISEQISGEANRMKLAFNGERNFPYSVKDIVHMVIERDHLYLVEKSGRPRQFHRPGVENSETGDRWLSHSIYYGAKGNTTGIVEFDRIFKEVGDYINNEIVGNPEHQLYERFTAVQKVYEEKSPHAQISTK